MSDVVQNTIQYKTLLDESKKLYTEFHRAPESERFKIFMAHEKLQNEIKNMEMYTKPNRCWCTLNERPCSSYEIEPPSYDGNCKEFKADDSGVCDNLVILYNDSKLHTEELTRRHCFSFVNPLNRKFTIKEYVDFVRLQIKLKKET